VRSTEEQLCNSSVVFEIAALLPQIESPPAHSLALRQLAASSRAAGPGARRAGYGLFNL